MNIVILGNQARAVSNFWVPLIRELTGRGHRVTVLVPFPEQAGAALPADLAACRPDSASTGPEGTGAAAEEAHEAALAAAGARMAHYRLDRKGLNPVRDLATLIDLYRFFRKQRPDRLFASTIKPVIYGSMASALARCPARAHRHLMITGLGYMFEGGSRLKKILMWLARGLYWLAFSLSGHLYFQNRDDRELFEELSIIPRGIRVDCIPGTGVDLAKFAVQPLPSGQFRRFLLVGRLLEAKGIEEFCQAAALLRPAFPEVEFAVLGPEEHGPGAFAAQRFSRWGNAVTYLGSTADVRPYLAGAWAVVLPSWREGVPCSLMEAMSTGRAVVAADAPGSREVVRDGVNGFLVPVRDAVSLAGAMERLLRDPELCAEFGRAGRRIVEEEFDAESIAGNIADRLE
jgi:Glycosyltransferase